MKCDFCDSSKNVSYSKKHNANICPKHKAQLYQFGKILEKTKFTKNDIVICEDYAEIILVNKQWNEVSRTKISLGKVDIVRNHKWKLRDDGYIQCRFNKKNSFIA